MAYITSAVGRGAPNKPADVLAVQQLLVRHGIWLWPAAAPRVTGQFDAITANAIVQFQKTAAALKSPNGLVEPGSFTLRQLERSSIPKPKHAIFSPLCFYHPAIGLTVKDYDAAAATLKCERAVIQAVARTETKRTPWEEQGRPTILFERHWFSKLTGGRYDRTHPDISNPVQGGYGRFSEQFPKLDRAAVLDESAALQSASWGTFQIMGLNYSPAGFKTVQGFVSAMMESEQRHLDAFVAFILSNTHLTKAVRTRNWSDFAYRYNGPDYKKNHYDTEMASAYADFAKAAAIEAPRRPNAPAR